LIKGQQLKKSKLIEILNKIPGNPEIKLWNGLTNDWMDIEPELVPTRLVKMTNNFYLETQRLALASRDPNYQMPAEQLAVLTKRYEQSHENKWEVNGFITREDVKEGRYAAKTVYVINAQLRDRSTTYDRYVSISY
jgi:hypothetical protein